MPRLYKGHKYILCIKDDVTNYLITVQIHQYRSEEICHALIENVISKYCVPDYIIMDQDSVFMSSPQTLMGHWVYVLYFPSNLETACYLYV